MNLVLLNFSARYHLGQLSLIVLWLLAERALRKRVFLIISRLYNWVLSCILTDGESIWVWRGGWWLAIALTKRILLVIDLVPGLLQCALLAHASLFKRAQDLFQLICFDHYWGKRFKELHRAAESMEVCFFCWAVKLLHYLFLYLLLLLCQRTGLVNVEPFDTTTVLP